MKARVRRPGSSAAVTAAAASRRVSSSGDWRRASPISSEVASPSRSTVIAEVCSLNRRDHAPAPGHRHLGQDDLLGLGQQVVAVATQALRGDGGRDRAGDRPGVRRPRSSSSAAHSRSKKRSLRRRSGSGRSCDPLHHGGDRGVGRVDREPQARRSCRPARPCRGGRPVSPITSTRASASSSATVPRRTSMRSASASISARAVGRRRAHRDGQQRLEIPGDGFHFGDSHRISLRPRSRPVSASAMPDGFPRPEPPGDARRSSPPTPSSICRVPSAIAVQWNG